MGYFEGEAFSFVCFFSNFSVDYSKQIKKIGLCEQYMGSKSDHEGAAEAGNHILDGMLATSDMAMKKFLFESKTYGQIESPFDSAVGATLWAQMMFDRLKK